MLSLVLLVSLSQAGLVMWTDAEGVVHVDEAGRAPARAKPISGEGYSRVDDDARPLSMPDGGTREDDSAWWRRRFASARAVLTEAAAREDDAQASIRASTREVCVKATAESSSSVGVWSKRGGSVIVTNAAGPVGVVQLGRGQGAQFSNTTTSTAERCESGSSTAGQRDALNRAREDRLAAARVVQALEAEAVRASVPQRYWR